MGKAYICEAKDSAVLRLSYKINLNTKENQYEQQILCNGY